MHNYYKALLDSLDETVPSHTYAAVFTMAVATGLITLSGLLFKPYESQQVVEKIKQKISQVRDIQQLDRIYRPLSPTLISQDSKKPPMDYGAYIAKIERMQRFKLDAQLKRKRSDRASVFSGLKHSEQHWAMLKESLRGSLLPSQKSPVVIPPVIMVGSAD